MKITLILTRIVLLFISKEYVGIYYLFYQKNPGEGNGIIFKVWYSFIGLLTTWTMFFDCVVNLMESFFFYFTALLLHASLT